MAGINSLLADETNDTTGTWQGIERSLWRTWTPTSIVFTGEQIEASRHQEGAFVRAAREEWAAINQSWRQYEQNMMYVQSKQWIFIPIDPDLEMDIGL